MMRRTADQAHRLLFGHDMTEIMRQFLRHLSFSVRGYVVANTVLFATVVLAGRLLGPAQFGQYALVMAIAQILIIAMLPGTDTAVMRETALLMGQARSTAITSGFIFALVTTGATVFGALTLTSTLAGWFGVSEPVWQVAVAVSLALMMRTFFDSVIRGKGSWRLQMWGRMLDALLVLGVFAAAYWILDWRDFRALAGGIFSGAMLAALIFWFWSVRSEVAGGKFTGAVISRLWRYGRFGVLGAIGGILLASTDKVILGKLLGTRELGVYQAYYFSSVQLTGQLALIFLNVFFPTIVRQRDLTIVLSKVDKLIGILFLPALGAIAGFIALTLWLFSGDFDLNAWLVLLMSCYSVLWFLYTTYWSLMASTGPGGMMYASVNGLIGGLIYVLVVYPLAKIAGVFAPPLAFLVVASYMAIVVCLWRFKFRFTLR